MSETRTEQHGLTPRGRQVLAGALIAAAIVLTACTSPIPKIVEATPTTVGTCIPIELVAQFPDGPGPMEIFLPPAVEGNDVSYYVFVVWNVMEWSEATGEKGTIFVEEVGSGGRTLSVIGGLTILSDFQACTDLSSAQRAAGRMFKELEEDENTDPSGGIEVNGYEQFLEEFQIIPPKLPEPVPLDQA
ncbi:hypothetical protein JW766_03215 [Candidatus Dojkabacteria bacterium]|nr:hypothetical protein [Candidatus Dojkabacteria bacterium]